MSPRGQMNHRCTIQRNTAPATDEQGAVPAPTWTNHLVDVPCYFYIAGGMGEVIDADKTAMISAFRMMIRQATDITERDRVVGITDRDGTVINSHTFNVRHVMRQRGYKSVMLETVA